MSCRNAIYNTCIDIRYYIEKKGTVDIVYLVIITIEIHSLVEDLRMSHARYACFYCHTCYMGIDLMELVEWRKCWNFCLHLK